jgi:hypothetical protein
VPDNTLITQEAALNRATILQTALAASKLRLCVGITPNPATTAAELIAAEATFSGYTSGGYALATWAGPGKTSTGAGVITAPTIQIKIVPPMSGPIVGNMLSGWWIETGTGEVLLVGSWDPARPMNVVTDQFPFAVQDVEGAVAPTS